MSNEPEQLGPHDRLHRNVFEQAAENRIPIRLNGKQIGWGTLEKDGGVKMEIEDEEARRLIAGGKVAALSVDYTSKTIEAIMKNRERRNI